MNSIVTAVFAIFQEIASWFLDSLLDFVQLFYSAEDGLTFIGVMALVGIGIGVVRMLFAIITSFVQFRGGH